MAPGVERRLAAILAADVVGYTRLVEQDEAGTLSALKDLRREVIDPLLTEMAVLAGEIGAVLSAPSAERLS